MNRNEHKLGLPIEYQQLPEYFDSHTSMGLAISEETKQNDPPTQPG